MIILNTSILLLLFFHYIFIFDDRLKGDMTTISGWSFDNSEFVKSEVLKESNRTEQKSLLSFLLHHFYCLNNIFFSSARVDTSVRGS